jgi:NADH:ubiquinone oxidoreductase subunit
MSIFKTLLRAVTWWDSQTIGTQLFTWRKGLRVGSDDQGNVYYHTANDKRRWVIFNGECEASRISPDWHGWLHRTWNDPPSDVPLRHQPWEKPHQANLTGSSAAYAPTGSLRLAVPAQRKDYEAWTPE